MESPPVMSILNPRPKRMLGAMLLHHLVRPASDDIAVEHLSRGKTTTISYRALHDISDALASRIVVSAASVQGQVQEQGQLVIPVLLHQSPDLYITLLAILKAGAAFCPLNLDAPPERIDFIMRDVGARIVVSSPELSANLPRDAGLVVLDPSQRDGSVDNSTAAAAAADARQKPHGASLSPRQPLPNSLAYVMYTSGSTGTPKGISISHFAASQALLAHDSHMPPFSRFLQFAAPTFDVSVFEIFFPLFRGSTLVSARRQEMLDNLPAVLRRMDVDACELTPTVVASLLKWRSNALKLRLLLTIGEMLNPRVVKEFGGSQDRESILWAMYGPTEVTIHCTLQTHFQASSSTGNIGRPLDTVSCFIIRIAVDDSDSRNFEILGLGKVGELAVGGQQLAVGYLNNESKTNATFINSPYGRVYRTGDKARMNADGTIECLGRIADGQVKLRGQRIELGEIEHAILKTQGCHGASARVIGTIIVGFCAVESFVSEDDILDSCRTWLPQFMVPGQVVLTSELPRLPSGKVDTKELERSFEESKQQQLLSEADEIPADIDSELVRILKDAFGPHLNMQTDLIRVGLDSLSSIGLSSNLRQAGYDMSATEVLKLKTIGQFVAAAAQAQGIDYLSPTQAISLLDRLPQLESPELKEEQKSRKVQDILPCTALQIAMLSESLLHPGAYWNTADLEIHATASRCQIEEAIRIIIEKNEILRTGFIHHNSTFYSVIFDDINSACITSLIKQPSTLTIQATLLCPLHFYIDQTEEATRTKIRLFLHHSIYDGWSLDLFKSDLAKAVQQQPLPWRAQFRDVTCFFVSGGECDKFDERARASWADYLFGWNKPPFPCLTSKLTQSASVGTARLMHTMPRATNLTSTVASAQVPFQAALALVWAGILGLADIVIGLVTSGRTIPVRGIESVMGPCVSSLPLRVNMEAMTTAADLLNSVAWSNRHMMEHSTLSQSSIKRLVSMYGAEPLYDVLFVFQDSPEQRRQTDCIVKELAHLDRLETKLLIEVQPVGNDVFLIQATYHQDSFSTQLVEIMLQQIAALSSALVTQPQESLQSAAQTLSANLSTYNMNLDKMSRPTGPDDLVSIVQEAVRHYSKRPAISFAGEISSTSPFSPTSISYHDLNRSANRIAHFLQSQRVETGSVMAIIMHKSILLYTAILGILKAGCGYLPLLPWTPRARILEIFKQSGCSLCLGDEDSLQHIAMNSMVRTILVDQESIKCFSDTDTSVQISSDQTAYVIYTSGTTGTPKGVAVSHVNIARNVSYLGFEYPEAVGRSSKLLQACSQAFDVSVFEIFFAWHKGMCLCVAPNDALFADIEETIRKFEITHLSLTPTIASLIDPDKVPTVSFLVTAGEPMTKAVHTRWNGLLWQGYGPSETTNICSIKRMSCEDYIEHLGLVFDNTSVVVVQPSNLSVVPVGWAGEFCFGGHQVANGYHNMPRLTAERFIQHPEAHGHRIYRSGDLGRMLPDGSLVIIGRIDDQLKLRGQRIEAAEVNGIVSAVSAATAAVTLVLPQKGSCGGERLVTFYVNGLGGAQEESFRVVEPEASLQKRLFAELHTRLLTYMVPSYVIPVSRIPLTSSGKVDKRAIHAVYSQLEKDYLENVVYNVTKVDDAEWTDNEKSVAIVIAEALDAQVADIGRWTPLAVMGLDSISAIKVSKRLSQILDVEIPISTVLQRPTVAQLAKVLGSGGVGERRPSPEILRRQYFDQQLLNSIRSTFAQQNKSVSDILPCLPLQEAMVSRGKTSYYNKALLRLRGSTRDMRGHWQHMCERHSILRTCFISTDSAEYSVAQVVLSEEWTLPWHEFSAVKQSSLDDALQKHLAMAPAPLDTYTPPLSLAIIRYRDSSFLSFLCHHALYDGVAMGCLWREMEARARGEPLPPVVAYPSFLDAALCLPRDSQSFWARQLAGFRPALLFPLLHVEKMQQAIHTVTVIRSLGRMQHGIKALGLSLLSVCQASMTRVLVQVSQKKDVCFGNVMGGRTIGLEGIERLVAPCFNTVPVRQEVSDSVSNLELAKALLRHNLELLRHQFTPLRQIQKLVSTRARSLFDTLLLVQQPLEEMDAQMWTLEQDSGIMDLPLVCEVMPCPSLDSLILNVYYDTSQVQGELAVGIAQLFKYFFSRILEFPHSNMYEGHVPPHLIDQIRYHQDLLLSEDEDDCYDSVANGVDESWSKQQIDVRSIFSKLSKVPSRSISHRTSLFKLGLDSINAVQISSLLGQKQYLISASDILECQTCLEISRRMSENQQKEVKQGHFEYDFEEFETKIRPAIHGLPATSLVLPCTPMQCAMLSSFISSGGINYLNKISLEMKEGISSSCVMSKFAQLVAGHAMLRTGFVPIRHADCTFAMVQHQEFAALQNMTIAGSQVFDEENWRRSAARDVVATLQVPPWRLLMTTRKAKVTLHLVIHHALYDAYSLKGILSNLCSLVNGMEMRLANDILPGLSAVMQRSLEKNNEDAIEFWRQTGEHATINKFPLLTPLREAEKGTLIEQATASISVSGLQKLAKKANVSVQAAMMATWTRLLAAYTGDEAVVFGVTLSGRTCESTLETPIPCLTTVPIVAQNQASNRELLEQARRWASQMYQYQFLPLSRILKEMGHAAAPVFDTLIAYQKTTTTTTTETVQDNREEFPWIQLQDEAVVEFPVSLEVEPAPDGDAMYLRITYWKDILPRQQAKMLLQQFDASLTHLLGSPDGHERDLAQQHPEICSISPPLEPVIKAPVELLHQFVEMQARINPNSLALEYVSRGLEQDGQEAMTTSCSNNSARWTFSQLNSMGNRVANILVSHRTKAGSMIAVHFDKKPEAYFAILGILKSGCAFVALDIHAPRARKEFIMQDCGASCLLTGSDEAMTLDFDVACPMIVLNDALVQDYPDTACIVDGLVSPSSTCYCLYTSGTTGTPKGCEITHENTVQCMMAFQDMFCGHWSDKSRWLQFAALHFDVSVLEQYWSWSVGIAVIAAKKDLILDDLVGFINNLDITHIDLTPSLARLVHPDTVPSLCRGVFITGGEPLKQEIIDAWGSKAVIYNAYGPTEATIGVTAFERVPRNGRPNNIGRPFRNVGVYVLGRRDTEMAVLRGAVGELCVSGRLVGKGYLNRAELTGTRFPTLTGLSRTRVYRTGDLVRMLHDGCLEFVGRADDQVKLRGQRLELGEIDHVIRSVANVEDAASIVTKHPWSGKDVLVSFLVEKRERRKKKEDVNCVSSLTVLEHVSGVGRAARKACRDKLPGYMVPSYFLQLSYIPLSSNNKSQAKQLKDIFSKLSHQALTRFSSAAMSMQRSIDATTDSDYQTLVALVSEFCGVKQDSLTEESSVFDYGIDSITALPLSSFLAGRGWTNASPAVIIRNPIMADLAAALSDKKDKMMMTSYDASAELKQTLQKVRACAHQHAARVCRVVGISPDEMEYLYPCSSLQQGMLAQTAIEREGREFSYFNTFRLWLTAEASVDDLEEAFRALFVAEPVLRMSFAHTPEGYVQMARRGISLPWEERRIAEDDKETLQDVVESMRQEWIDANQSQWRMPFKIVYISGLRLVILHIFHGLYDGVSFGLLMAKLAGLYRGTETPAPGPAFTEALIRGPLRDHERFKSQWIQHLRGWKPVSLLFPAEKNKKKKTSKGSEAVTCASRVLDQTLMERLRSRRNVSMQSVLLSAWTCALMQKCCAGPVTTGVVVSGRSMSMEGVENVMGPMFNTVPFLASAGLPERTWDAVLARCQDFHAMVLSDAHVPLQSIQKWVSDGSRLFDNLFVYQAAMDGAAAAAEPDKTVPWVIEQGGGGGGGLPSNYRLVMEISKRVDDGQLGLLVEAGRGVASEHQLQQLLDCFEDMLQSMETGGEVPVQPDTLTCCCYPSLTTALEEGQQGQQEQAAWNWTENATIMRREVAALAQIAETEVKPWMTWVELGLDSIDAVQLSARLKKKQKLLLSPSIIMFKSRRSISEMANAVELLRDGQDGERSDNDESASLAESWMKGRLGDAVQALGLDLTEIEHVLPTTPLQDVMVSGMMETDFGLYLNHEILQVALGVDVDRLQAAWAKLFTASPILRTGFVEISDARLSTVYAQVVYKAAPAVGMESVESMSQLRSIMARNTQDMRREDGRRGLARVVGVTISGQEQKRTFFVLSISHALYDGWSLGLLHQDLRVAYDDVVGVEIKPRPAPDEFLFRSAAIATSTEAENFWKAHLDGVRPTILDDVWLPSNDGGGGLNTTVKRLLERRSHVITLHAAHDFCKRLSISLQALFQACWAILLARRTRSLDVVFGTVLSGRDFAGAEDLLFPTMNTVAFRCILHGSVASFMQYVEETIGQVRSYQMFPLRRAKAAAMAKARRGGGDLFNSLFLLQKLSLPSAAAAARTTDTCCPQQALFEHVDGSIRVDYPVCVEVAAHEGCIQWTIACQSRPGGKTEESMAEEELIDELEKIVGYVVAHAESELVVFSARGVEICASQPITLAEDEQEQDEKEEEEKEEDMYGYNQPVCTPSPRDEWTATLLATIRKTLSQVSGVPEDSIEPTSTLYHVGLDSITAIKVSSLLKKEGILLRPTELMSSASMTEMAKLASLSSSSNNNNNNNEWMSWKPPSQAGIETVILEAVGLSMTHVQHILPALPMQVYMMSVWENNKATHHDIDQGIFYPEFAYRFRGPHSVDEILEAWAVVRDRLPMLRTCLVPTGLIDLPFVQVVLKPGCVVAMGDSDDSFLDSPIGPLVKLQVWETATASEKHLRLRIHHALYDGVSLPATMDVVVAVLRGGVNSLPPLEEDKLSLCMNRWAGELCAAQTEARRTHRRAFWTRYLGDCQTRKVDFHESQQQQQNKEQQQQQQCYRTSHFQKAALSNTNSFVDTASAHGISVQSLVFAAYALTVAARQYKEEEEEAIQKGDEADECMVTVVFGVYLASRLDEGVADTLPTLRVVPLCVSVESEALKTIMEVSLERRRLNMSHGCSLARIIVQVACKIHGDMQRIRADDVASQVGLWEIGWWTGVKVDKFVNFLTLPGVDEEEEEEKEEEGEKEEEVVDESREVAHLTKMAVSEAVGDGLPFLSSSSLVGRNAVSHFYPDSVDMEFSIRNQHLDIGVFGPRTLVTREEAVDLMLDVVKCLKGLEEGIGMM